MVFEDKQLVESMWHTLVVLSPYTLIPSFSQNHSNQPKMSSLNMFLAPATAISSTNITTTSITSNATSIATTRPRRVRTFATASKGSSGSDEKGIFEWLMGALDKDGLLETDPILQKVEGKSSGTTTTGKKTTSSVAPPKKSKSGGEGGFGGLGGLFSKK